MKRLLLLLFIAISTTGYSQMIDGKIDHKKMEWFGDAKLGIFIHWGIYAVNGIDESWSFYNGYIDYDDYMKQLDGFTASKYNPEYWADIIKTSGAKYAVITTKHHDGVALWNTGYGDLSVPKKTPAARDVLTPFVSALKKKKIKTGLYYSLSDWSHPDYPNHTNTIKRYENDSLRWATYLTYCHGHIEELMTAYRPDLVWFDGDWEAKASEWKAKEIRTMILAENPKTIINGRLTGYGDYGTPEQYLPIHRPESAYWELCMTMNDNWGYQHNDHNYKTSEQIIQIFVDVISKGGNLLLDITPMADGTIPDKQVEILEDLGRWTAKHKEAIYGTQAGLPQGYFYGASTLSADSAVLYLFLPNQGQRQIMVKGLKNQINRIRVVGNGTKLSHQVHLKPYWSNKAGVIFIDIPEGVADEMMTVIAVQLKGRIALDGIEDKD